MRIFFLKKKNLKKHYSELTVFKREIRDKSKFLNYL